MRLVDLWQSPAPLLVLFALTGAIFLAWPRSADRRRLRVEKWATRKLVLLTPDVTTALDEALTSRDRLGAAALAMIAAGSAAVAIASPSEPTAISATFIVLTTGVLVAMVTMSWRLARPWFAVDAARSARGRAVALRDYVFPPVRWLAWVAALACLADSAFALLSAPSPAGAAVRAAPLIGVAVAMAASEWVGRRTVRLPQPARDAAELYALDAWRCEVAGDGFHFLPLWAVQALIFSSYSGPADDGIAVTFQLTGWVLLVLILLFQRFPAYSITWTRHRLWSDLPDGTTIEKKAVTL